MQHYQECDLRKAAYFSCAALLALALTHVGLSVRFASPAVVAFIFGVAAFTLFDVVRFGRSLFKVSYGLTSVSPAPHPASSDPSLPLRSGAPVVSPVGEVPCVAMLMPGGYRLSLGVVRDRVGDL